MVRFPSLALAILLAACSFGISGITRERAIALATRQSGNTRVVGAASGPLRRFTPGSDLPNLPPDRQVWGVVFAGKFPSSCRPNAPACPPDATTMLVVLDYRTGEFLFATTPAP